MLKQSKDIEILADSIKSNTYSNGKKEVILYSDRFKIKHRNVKPPRHDKYLGSRRKKYECGEMMTTKEMVRRVNRFMNRAFIYDYTDRSCVLTTLTVRD